MPFGYVVTPPARVQHVHHRVGTEEHPQLPAVALFAFLVHEDQPARLVGLLIGRLPDAFLDRLIQRLEQGQQPLQATGHRARRDRQAQEFPGGQQPFGRPMAGVLVQQDLQPHRRAQETLGDQLGWRRRRARLAARAGAGRLIAAAANHAAVGLDLDLNLLGVLAVAPLAPGARHSGDKPVRPWGVRTSCSRVGRWLKSRRCGPFRGRGAGFALGSPSSSSSRPSRWLERSLRDCFSDFWPKSWALRRATSPQLLSVLLLNDGEAI